MFPLNSTDAESTPVLDRISHELSRVTGILNYMSVVPMGILGPILSVSLLLYTVRAFVILQRRYRAEAILFNQDNCREDELQVRELNYNVNRQKYILILFVSLAEMACLAIPIGPFIVTYLYKNKREAKLLFENKEISCGDSLTLNVMTHHVSARIYLAIARALLFVFLSLLRLLVTYLTNAYRERLKYTKFRKHFLWMFILTILMVSLDIQRYTFVPNLFVGICIILTEYVLVWRSLKDLRWATKWKLIDLQRDSPNEFKTRKFKTASNIYRKFSHLLSIGLFSMLMALLIMSNVLPIFDFLTHISYYLPAIYPRTAPLLIDFKINCSVIDLIQQTLYLMLNLFLTLATLTTIYPFSFYFTILILNEFIFWMRRRNSQYPRARPELITSLLEWHRKYYVYKQDSAIII